MCKISIIMHWLHGTVLYKMHAISMYERQASSPCGDGITDTIRPHDVYVSVYKVDVMMLQ